MKSVWQGSEFLNAQQILNVRPQNIYFFSFIESEGYAPPIV